jgi:hypothetical protein
MMNARVATPALAEDVSATVNRFVDLAAKGLVPMFDRQRQLFCFRLKKTGAGMVREGISHRYTAMTLMGLHRLGQAGMISPFDTASILQTMLSDLSWVDNLGDLGMLLWLCAIVSPQQLPVLERRLQLEAALTRFRDARQAYSMELAWFLTGLSYWGQLYPQKLPQLEPLAFETYNLLTTIQGERGFFEHLSTSRSLSGMVRGRVGSFADQVYPIYGMAQFAKAYHNEEAAQRALKCAVGVCDMQGPLGQWWWHYDSVGGRVTDGYPVFSVHQHAMGPMTLFKLGEVINHSFDEWIYKGLRWINSNNELDFDMEDPSRGVIWRCIFRSRRSLVRYFRAGFGHYSDTVQHPHPGDLKILFECRPYELGWLLYAFANRAGCGSHTGEPISQTQVAGKN